MKKILIFIYIISLTIVSVSSQESYRLDKVVITVHDYNTKSAVFAKNLNDSVQILTSDWDFPVLPVFKTVTLADNIITSVELLNDGTRYNLDAKDNILILTKALSPKNETTELSGDNDSVVTESLSGFQLPNYTIQHSGDVLTITFDNTIYGASNYPRQALEGTCQMIYVKL